MKIKVTEYSTVELISLVEAESLEAFHEGEYEFLESLSEDEISSMFVNAEIVDQE